MATKPKSTTKSKTKTRKLTAAEMKKVSGGAALVPMHLLRGVPAA